MAAAAAASSSATLAFLASIDFLRDFSASANKLTFLSGLSEDAMPPKDIGIPKAKRKNVSSRLIFFVFGDKGLGDIG